jgi:hypothetical protein
MKQKMKPADISGIKVITLKESAEILGMNYHTARQRIMSEGLIGYFDYNGKISVIEEDVREYKRSHFITPKNKTKPTILNKFNAMNYVQIEEAPQIVKNETLKATDIVEIKSNLVNILEILLRWAKDNN